MAMKKNCSSSTMREGVGGGAKGSDDGKDEKLLTGMPRGSDGTVQKKAAKASHAKVTARKKKPKKPADMPRRPLSAYNIFFQEHRKIILQEREAAGLTDSDPGLFRTMAQTIGRRWKGLEKDGLEKYKKLAAEDARRYSQEMEAYQQKVATKYVQTTEPNKTKHLNISERQTQEIPSDSSVQSGPLGPASRNPSLLLYAYNQDNQQEQQDLLAAYLRGKLHRSSTSGAGYLGVDSMSNQIGHSSPYEAAMSSGQGLLRSQVPFFQQGQPTTFQEAVAQGTYLPNQDLLARGGNDGLVVDSLPRQSLGQAFQGSLELGYPTESRGQEVTQTALSQALYGPNRILPSQHAQNVLEYLSTNQNNRFPFPSSSPLTEIRREQPLNGSAVDPTSYRNSMQTPVHSAINQWYAEQQQAPLVAASYGHQRLLDQRSRDSSRVKRSGDTQSMQEEDIQEALRRLVQGPSPV